ncbi:hypothetical protein PG984_003572 [Apiospora sp. TS-2023a]
MTDPLDMRMRIAALQAMLEYQEQRRRKETEAKILALKAAAKPVPADLDQQIAALQAAAEAQESRRKRETEAEILALKTALKAADEAEENARKLASNNKSANSEVTPQSPILDEPEDHIEAIAKRIERTCWFIALILFLLLLLVAVRLHLEHVPDQRLEATFQPHHDIADMFNYTRPVLDTLERVVENARNEVASIGLRMKFTELPDKENIARDIHITYETMYGITSRMSRFEHNVTRMVDGLHYSYSLILGELEYRHTLSRYLVADLVIPINARLRRGWLNDAVRARDKLAKVSAEADGLQKELADLAKSFDGIERRMAESQRAHEEQVKRLKSRWFYRFNIFASPIIEYNCEADTKKMSTHLEAVAQAAGGIIIRRDVLAAASNDLAPLQPTTWSNRILDGFHRFGRRYQKQADSMLKHMIQALDCESWAGQGPHYSRNTCYDGY